MAERRSFSFRTVLLGLLVSFALAGAAAVYLYYVYLQYERVAARHLPRDTRAAVRLDLEKVVLYEPIRRHVLPLANERARAGGADSAARPTRLERIQSATGIELGVDLRELVLGWGPGPGDWVLVVGGRFPRDGVLPGLERVLREEGHPWSRSADGSALLSPEGHALGQAADGSLIAASGEQVLRSALPDSDTFERLGLPLAGPGGFAVGGEAVRGFVPPALRLLAPPLGVVDQIQRVEGRLELGPDMAVTSDVHVQGATAEQVAEGFRRLAGGARAIALLPGAPQGPLRAAERLQVAVASPAQVQLTARWTREEVDAAAADLARFLRTLFGWTG
jgi:hypothetical protein